MQFKLPVEVFKIKWVSLSISVLSLHQKLAYGHYISLAVLDQSSSHPAFWTCVGPLCI